MKKLLRTAVILCILLSIGIVLHRMTLNTTSEGCIQLWDFYRLPEETVDVLFVGSSHVYYSYNTCQMYEDYGLAAYLLASPGQPVWISYYMIEEALKTQEPKLIVFDACTLYQRDSKFSSLSWESLISMKPSLTKWKAIQASSGGDDGMDRAGAFFSFPYYHTRYSELEKNDYKNTDRLRYNGYKPDFQKIPKSDLVRWKDVDKENFDQIRPVSERTEKYLRMLIELCQNRKIPLVIVNSPYLNHMEEKQTAYNYVSLIADEYGVPYVDANEDIDEIQIDYANDMLDVSHLNYYGGIKYTNYFSKWLTENYTLPDRRNDERYRHWTDVSVLFWHSQLNAKRLKSIQDFGNYMETLRDTPDSLVVTYHSPGGETAVYEDGQMVYSHMADSDFQKHFDLGGSDLAVSGSGGTVRIMLDKKEYLYVEQGMNVLVYDKVAQQRVDGVGFDETEGGKAVRKRIRKGKIA